MEFILDIRRNFAPASDTQRRRLEIELAENRGFYIFEGIVFVLLAAMVVGMPEITAFAVEVLTGVFLLVAGGFRLFRALREEHHRWWRTASGLVMGGVGVFMLLQPGAGLAIMIAAIGLLLLVEGAMQVMLALAIRPVYHWGWMLASGIISVLLGLLLLVEFPMAGVLYISIALGLSMALYGFSLIALAWNARKAGEGMAGGGGSA